MAGIRLVSFGYMDDVKILSNNIRDLGRVDDLCRMFEAAAGAIINRNRNTVVVGLGAWARRCDWPLRRLHCDEKVKVLGGLCSPPTSAAHWRRPGSG